MGNRFQKIAFTDSVKRAQEAYGSRRHFARFDDEAEPEQRLSDSEIDFIEQRDGLYIGTVGEGGQPYIQFRGGPRGFLKVLDDRTLGFADFRGNLQYISVGNADVNPKVALFLMDYANRRRLKIFGEIGFTKANEDPTLTAELSDDGYKAKAERIAKIRVNGFDWNCPQHITPRYTADDVRAAVGPLRERIGFLEAELAKYKETK